MLSYKLGDDLTHVISRIQDVTTTNSLSIEGPILKDNVTVTPIGNINFSSRMFGHKI